MSRTEQAARRSHGRQPEKSSGNRPISWWIRRLEGRGLPLMETTADEISRFNTESSRSVHRFCGQLGADPAVALELIRQVNRRMGPNSDTRVASVSHAAMMLGVSRIKRLPFHLKTVKLRSEDRKVQGYLRAASRAWHAAWMARVWAEYQGDPDPEEVFLATQLRLVGEYMMWMHGGEVMEEVVRLRASGDAHSEEARYLALGFPIEHLSRELARRWKLPPLVERSLDPAGAQDPRIYTILLAQRLAQQSERGWYHPGTVACLEAAAEHLGFAPDEMIASTHAMAAELAREPLVAGLPMAAALLPLLPSDQEEEQAEVDDTSMERERGSVTGGESPEESGKSMEEAPPRRPAGTSGPSVKEQVARTAEAPTKEVEVVPGDGGPAPQGHHVGLAPQVELYEEAILAIRRGVRKGIDLNALIDHVMRGLQQGAGLNRVVFALLDGERRNLVGRYLVGADSDPHFSRFTIALNPPNLFSRLMAKPQSVWVGDDNRSRLWPLVPVDFQRLIRTDSFFAMSLFVAGKPVGLFYADRRDPELKLDPVAYQRFKAMVNLVSRTLGLMSQKQAVPLRRRTRS